MQRNRAGTAVLSLLAVAAVALAATEQSAGGLRWTVPTTWTVQPARPMRAATYTIPAASGAEAGECGVFFFGKGQGGTVEENLDRWTKQFEGATAPKKADRTVGGLRVHTIEL